MTTETRLKFSSNQIFSDFRRIQFPRDSPENSIERGKNSSLRNGKIIKKLKIEKGREVIGPRLGREERLDVQKEEAKTRLERVRWPREAEAPPIPNPAAL